MSKPAYIKVMFAFSDSVYWDMRTNEELSAECLANVIEGKVLKKWEEAFEKHYMEWLENDIPNEANDLTQPYINNLIQHLKDVNTEGYNIFYWTDVDRTLLPDYKWEICPLSGEKLIELGADFSYLNRLISPAYLICFPMLENKP